MRNSAVSLLIPGLFEAFDGIDPSLFPEMPSVTRLVSRAKRSSLPTLPNPESRLLDLLCPDCQLSKELPTAALRWRHDFAEPPMTPVICADPVYLRADQTELRLFADETFRFDRDMADELVTKLNELYAEDPLTFVVAAPDRWYICLQQAAEIATQPLSAVLGQNVSDYLPQGKDARYWRGLFNEIQMFLNTELSMRSGSHTLPNSLWFHGMGTLPAVPTKAPRDFRLLSNQSFAQGVACWLSMPIEALPDTADSLVQGDGVQGDGQSIYIVLDQLAAPVAYGDFTAWGQQLEILEKNWIAPLLKQLKKRRIRQLNLYTNRHEKNTLTTYNIMNIFSRKTPFHQLCRAL
ncbi:MAG: hypothetical protein V3W04_06750 [Gammaproteobacteria bacterium]